MVRLHWILNILLCRASWKWESVRHDWYGRHRLSQWQCPVSHGSLSSSSYTLLRECFPWRLFVNWRCNNNLENRGADGVHKPQWPQLRKQNIFLKSHAQTGCKSRHRPVGESEQCNWLIQQRGYSRHDKRKPSRPFSLHYICYLSIDWSRIHIW